MFCDCEQKIPTVFRPKSNRETNIDIFFEVPRMMVLLPGTTSPHQNGLMWLAVFIAVCLDTTCEERQIKQVHDYTCTYDLKA